MALSSSASTPARADLDGDATLGPSGDEGPKAASLEPTVSPTGAEGHGSAHPSGDPARGGGDATLDAGEGSSVLASDAAVSASASLPREGETIGRFVIVRLLGRGGMGAVFLAEDPELNRRVAIKVVAAGDDGSSAAATARLHREAQSMARVVHPNLVHVYDVGTVRGRVWIAMEYIEGMTLKAWLSAHSDATREEILERFVAAGRGIAAAHRAGLVHRDFKPDNVMCGADGIVRVLDFGLARDVATRAPAGASSAPSASRPASVTAVGADVTLAADSAGSVSSPSPSGSSSSGHAPADLTQTGAVMGTPAYMAPEQHRGERADARTDIFAYCVALFEALHRRRPFEGTTLLELMTRVLSDAPVVVPRDGTPRWLDDAIVRGLERAPNLRWQSMDELLGALEHGPDARGQARGVRTVAWTTGVLALTGLGVVVAVARPWDRGAAVPASADAAAARPSEDAPQPATPPEVRQQLASILVAPNPRERLQRAELYLEEVGDTGGAARRAIAEASAAASLWELSCPDALMGLCFERIEDDPGAPAVRAERGASRRPAKADPESLCSAPNWPPIVVRTRGETADRARQLAQAALDHAVDGLPADADSVEREAWAAMLSQAHAILADTELEHFVAETMPRVVAPGEKLDFELTIDDAHEAIARIESRAQASAVALAALVPRYERVAHDFAGFARVAAHSRLGIARQVYFDGLIRTRIRRGKTRHDWSSDASYCVALMSHARPVADQAVNDFRACSREAMAARLSSEFVDLCDSQVAKIERLDRQRVREVIRDHIEDLRACYNTSLASYPDLELRLSLKFTIGAEGKVTDLAFEDIESCPDHALPACLADQFRSWTFPAPEDGVAMVITYPLHFAPG